MPSTHLALVSLEKKSSTGLSGMDFYFVIYLGIKILLKPKKKNCPTYLYEIIMK